MRTTSIAFQRSLTFHYKKKQKTKTKAKKKKETKAKKEEGQKSSCGCALTVFLSQCDLAVAAVRDMKAFLLFLDDIKAQDVGFSIFQKFLEV